MSVRPVLAAAALLAAGLATAAPAHAACYSYRPGSPVVYRRIGDNAVLVVYGPGTLTVTPTDCP
ncbi:MAG TPA: hypothetical protein VNQ77_02005 [Frankiaceae bacterium]|nr:hypothetical protein [Frankiaceae bacterium]